MERVGRRKDSVVTAVKAIFGAVSLAIGVAAGEERGPSGSRLNEQRGGSLVAVTRPVSGATSQPTTRPATRPSLVVVRAPERPTGIVFHLPGIGGHLRIDDSLLRGLVEGRPGEALREELYDWPAYDLGVGALSSVARNKQEAAVVARRLEALAKAYPGVPIYVTAHSGGAGIAAWALEDLPAGVQVDQLVLLANALSPGFDMGPALKHVRGKCYVVTSETDTVLKMCAAFGTVDRVYTPAAGLSGFEMKDDKLVTMPYQEGWMNLDNLGDHIGPMQRAFAAKVLAPLLVPAARGEGGSKIP